jgi:hypothetical protein
VLAGEPCHPDGGHPALRQRVEQLVPIKPIPRLEV